MTELIPLDSLRNAAVFGDLPLYRPTSSGQGSILGSSAEAPYPFLTFRPPEAPNFGSENGGPAEWSAYPVAYPLDFHFSSVSSEAKGASLGRAQTPNSSLFWPSVPTSGADLLAWPTSVGLAEGGVQHPLLEMAVASARGLARLLSAGKGWASDGNSWSGAFGKLFGVLSSQVGKAFLSGKVHQAAAAGLAERSSGASIRAQPMVPGNPGSSANQAAPDAFLPSLPPLLSAEDASLAAETPGPFVSLWQEATRAAKAAGSRIFQPSKLGKAVAEIASRLRPQTPAGGDATGGLLAAGAESAHKRGASGVALEAQADGKFVVNGWVRKENDHPFDAIGSMRVGRVTDREEEEVKSLGQQLRDALAGMAEDGEGAGTMGTTLFFPSGLWATVRGGYGVWDGFSGSTFGDVGGFLGEGEAEAGLSVAQGAPLRAMVGAARSLSVEEESDGPSASSAPLLILLG